MKLTIELGESESEELMDIVSRLTEALENLEELLEQKLVKNDIPEPKNSPRDKRLGALLNAK